MKKFRNKLAVFFLAVAAVMSLSISAYADNAENEDAGEGSTESTPKTVWCPTTGKLAYGQDGCAHNLTVLNKWVSQKWGDDEWEVNADAKVQLSSSQISIAEQYAAALNSGASDAEILAQFGVTITAEDPICKQADGGCGVVLDYASSTDGGDAVKSSDQSAAEYTAISDENKSAAQKVFEDFIFDTAFDVDFGAESSNSFSTVNLLKRTFVYAIVIMEGDDGGTLLSTLGAKYRPEALNGYNGLIHEQWYLAIECIAMVILLIRFMNDMATDKVWQSADRNTAEQWMKPFARLIIGILFVLLVHYALAFGLYLSQAAFSVMQKSISTNASASASFASLKTNVTGILGFEKKGIVNAPANTSAFIMGLIAFLIPFLCSQICKVGIMFVCFSRVLELVVRAVFAPLAMTDCYKSGERTQGFKYIMDFFALSFQSVAIFVVLWASSLITSLITSNIISESANTLAGGVGGVSTIGLYIAALKMAQLALILKTGTITKSVFGA